MAESLKGKLATVLVVDDADEVLGVIVRILETADFDVLHANSGYRAVEVARDYLGRIDLLLSDLQMPGMSGTALADTLRQSRPDIHVILMSSFTGGPLSANKYGWAFIEKPFVPARLIGMIDLVLQTSTVPPDSYEYGSRNEAFQVS